MATDGPYAQVEVIGAKCEYSHFVFWNIGELCLEFTEDGMPEFKAASNNHFQLLFFT